MSKKKDTFINMVVSLFVITIISGFSLGFVNDLTVQPIKDAKIAKKIKALKLVLPEFDNNPVENVKMIKSDLAKDSVEIYSALKGDENVGTAIIGSSEKGFSGLVRLMVGFKPDGSIQNIQVLEQKETPGLGTKMKEEKFLQQFRDKNPTTFKLKPTKDQGDVDALTGATISTRAFSEATQMAYDIFEKESSTTQPKKD
ncbi:RnfABCDGE type electron transport complex subunit G [Lutibacter citreus]|uniref:RnfABCDGE type electron transport complex subunit G n=1 Tax=Lutibacter citreus TaxID=2138210 RepID=UPI000DBE932E|nr:RnfABCDGE type electron transport complex subunit G [Lutibacter citreus]